MYQVEIFASVRETSGKGAMRRLRDKGLTPGVVYGGGREAQSIQLDSKILMGQLLEFYKVNTVVTLKVDGSADRSVIVGEVQTDPIRETLVHADFCEIDLEQEREFSVPVVFEGIPKGVDLGGIKTILSEKIVLKAKPLDIPDEIVVNVKNLGIDGVISVGDVQFADTITVVTSAQKGLITVIK